MLRDNQIYELNTNLQAFLTIFLSVVNSILFKKNKQTIITNAKPTVNSTRNNQLRQPIFSWVVRKYRECLAEIQIRIYRHRRLIAANWSIELIIKIYKDFLIFVWVCFWFAGATISIHMTLWLKQLETGDWQPTVKQRMTAVSFQSLWCQYLHSSVDKNRRDPYIFRRVSVIAAATFISFCSTNKSNSRCIGEVFVKHPATWGLSMWTVMLLMFSIGIKCRGSPLK